MISFKEQFIECRRDGYHERGDLVEKKNDKEKNTKKNDVPIKNEKLRNDKEKHLPRHFVKCLRFGDICDSSNKKCRKMRGVD